MTTSIEIISESIPNQDKANELIEKLIAVADTKTVFGEPIESGDYKVLTASEVTIGMGVGFGGGGGVGQGLESSTEDSEQTAGYGAGGGGGGVSMARPVAAIEIGPHGVRVEPIVDPTKIVIAFFTTLVSMFTMMAKMRRASHR